MKKCESQYTCTSKTTHTIARPEYNSFTSVSHELTWM